MTKERELLRRALEVLDEKVIGYEITKGVIRTYLSTTSDDAEKPVGYQWLHSGHFRKQIPKNANVIEWYPLYLHPPKPAETEARKPMTEEEIEQYLSTKTWPEPFKDGFDAGIRCAEKYHGITDADV